MLLICYVGIALSTMSTTVCLLFVNTRLSSCFEVLEYLNTGDVTKIELTTVRDQNRQRSQALDHMTGQITFKDTMSSLMWTRQRHSPVPTRLFVFLFVIMACVCHCRSIVGSKAIVQIDRILFGIRDVVISLGLFQYPIDSRQVRISYSARVDRDKCSTHGIA